MNTKDELIDWLRDAYAMEKAMELTLQRQIDSDETLQPLRDQFELHHAETIRHAGLVKECLAKVGGDTSMLKTTLAEAIETLKQIGASFARDSHVKDVLAAYAAEHFEIGCYIALAAGARRLAYDDVAHICEAILAEEKRMAGWLEENLPRAVISYLQEAVPHSHRVPPPAPKRHVEDIDTPVEAGSDDDPAGAWRTVLPPRATAVL